MEQNHYPLVSVIIINYNGKEFLHSCIASVLKSNYNNYELLFNDNDSSDDSFEFVKRNFNDERLKSFKNDKNHGVPGGRNIGFQHARGEYVVFLDNDTEVHPEWLAELMRVFKNDSKIAVAQCKLLKINDRKKFDHAGDYLTPSGFLYERSRQCIDEGQFDFIDDILSAKGAATMIKSSVFKELGMYDATYFMYLEETDFCFRVWLAGYRVVFSPRSIVWHAYETPLKERGKYYSNYIVRYYGCKNYITTLMANLAFFNAIRIVPIHIVCWGLLSFSFALKGRLKDAFWIIKGILWNVFNIHKVLRKRAWVQKNIRKVKDSEIFSKVMKHQMAPFYFKKAVCYLND